MNARTKRLLLGFWSLVCAAVVWAQPVKPRSTVSSPDAGTSTAPRIPAATTALAADGGVGTSPTKVDVKVEGCLATASTKQTQTQTRGIPSPPVLEVHAIAGGVQVVHDFSHACCLTAQVKTSESKGVLEVRETLSGTACKCICSSKISTVVPAQPGKYRVKVVQRVGKQTKLAGEREVAVESRN